MAQIENHTAALPFLQKRILPLQQERQPCHFLPFPDLSQAQRRSRGALGRRAPSSSGGPGVGAPSGPEPPQPGRGRGRSRRSARHSRGSSARLDGAVSAGCEPVTMALCPAVAASPSAARPYLLRKCLL